MARLKRDNPIIPPESVLDGFRELDLANKPTWVNYGISKYPISSKWLCSCGYSAKYEKHWTDMDHSLDQIGKTANLSDGKNDDGTYRTHPEKVVGIGIVLNEANKLICADWDNCISTNLDGTITIQPEAIKAAEKLNSYVEISASGTGLHFFFLGNAPVNHKTIVEVDHDKGLHRELYHKSKFIALTGNCLKGYSNIKALPDGTIQSFYDDFYVPYIRSNANAKRQPQKRNTVVKKVVTGENQNLLAIRRHDWQALRAILQPEEQSFQTPGEFYEELNEFPLDKFLGLPSDENFNCLFHDDNVASARIYINNDHYLYHCFSENKSLNIVQITEKLGNFRFKTDAYSFLKKALNMKVIINPWYEQQRQEIQFILDAINTIGEDSFKVQCPTAYGNLWRGLPILSTLLVFIRDNAFSIKTDEKRIIFGITKKRLTKLCYDSGITGNEKTVWGWKGAFCVSEILDTLPDEKVPPELMKVALAKTEKGHRHATFFEIKPWVADQIEHIEQRAKVYRQNKYTMKSLSYETVKAVEGEAAARRYYTQGAKDNREIATVSKAHSARMMKLSEEVEMVALDLMERQSYYTETGILDEIIFRCKGDISYSEIIEYERTIRRHRQDIANKYDFRKIKLTKALKENNENLKDIKGFPWIWISCD